MQNLRIKDKKSGVRFLYMTGRSKSEEDQIKGIRGKGENSEKSSEKVLELEENILKRNCPGPKGTHKKPKLGVREKSAVILPITRGRRR